MNLYTENVNKALFDLRSKFPRLGFDKRVLVVCRDNVFVEELVKHFDGRCGSSSTTEKFEFVRAEEVAIALPTC